MKSIYDGATKEHVDILKENYKRYTFKNKWEMGVDSLFSSIVAAKVYPSLIKGHYVHNLNDSLSEDEIDKILNYEFFTDTPIVFIYEYNKDATICRYNIVDMFSLTYSSFEIDLSKVSIIPNIMSMFTDEFNNALNKQIIKESDNYIIKYLVKNYGIDFISSSIEEQIFETIL